MIIKIKASFWFYTYTLLLRKFFFDIFDFQNLLSSPSLHTPFFLLTIYIYILSLAPSSLHHTCYQSTTRTCFFLSYPHFPSLIHQINSHCFIHPSVQVTSVAFSSHSCFISSAVLSPFFNFFICSMHCSLVQLSCLSFWLIEIHL